MYEVCVREYGCMCVGECLKMVHWKKKYQQLIPIVNRPWDKRGPIISYYFDVWCRNHIDNTYIHTHHCTRACVCA